MRTSLILFVSAVAALLFGTIAAPVAAKAASEGLLCEIFACISDLTTLSCSLSTVQVDGTPSRHHYSFGYVCDNMNGEAHIEGAYDLATGVASEKITAASGKWTFRATWNCASDPWVAPDVLDCRRGKVSAKGNPGPFSDNDIVYVMSAGSLSAKSRHVLAAQLQNALNATPESAPPAAPADSPTDTKGADHSDVLDSTFPEKIGPDLTVIRIDGPTTLSEGMSSPYTFIVGNIGNGSGSVEVSIAFVGAVDLIGQVSADSGLNCSITRFAGTGLHNSIDCTGGQLDPQRSATISMQAIAVAPGAGSIKVGVNQSGALAEGNYDNNIARRDVAVN